MRRKPFDRLISVTGLFIGAVLIVAGSLLTWAHTFVGDEVHSQLAAQQIYFPAKGSPAIAAPEFAAMRQYAGQQLTTGAQAEVYADHFIANHLKAIGGGRASTRSCPPRRRPTRRIPSSRRPSKRSSRVRHCGVFVLNAYAFGTMGAIAGIAGIPQPSSPQRSCCCWAGLVSGTAAGSWYHRVFAQRSRAHDLDLASAAGASPR